MKKTLSEPLANFLRYKDTPWGKLFYELVWHQLDELQGDVPGETPRELRGKRILDFGSGFGVTAEHLAQHNAVTAVEPNEEMVENRLCQWEYTQILGGLEWLKSQPQETFDVILCHNVLEYAGEREAILAEFARVLKPEGVVSIVKHNRMGKIMQKAVFEYKPQEVLTLLRGEDVASQSFGTIQEYEDEELEVYAKGKLKIDRCFGIRVFYALQSNDLKTGADWKDNMMQLECAAAEVPELRNIAFFHHVILKRV